ncbi:MAG: GNAT family N-acetyltransferase, partial [Rhizobacter sp.]|nr:GNAT family N-acetyltransferase [Rhizobacter sp.]
RAHEGEAEALCAIALESKAFWSYSKAQLEAWRGELTVTQGSISTGLAWVADVDGRVAGFFVLAPSPRLWTLEHFWVLPDFMRRGVGRSLLSRAAELAVRGGAEGIAIDADPNAAPFYRACGAMRTGSLAAPIDGQPQRVRPQMLLPVGPGDTRPPR